MAKCLISFPSAAMIVPEDEWEAVGRDAHAVMAAKTGAAKTQKPGQIYLSLWKSIFRRQGGRNSRKAN